MSQLPKSLSYGANQMPFRVNKYQVMPVGSDINMDQIAHADLDSQKSRLFA